MKVLLVYPNDRMDGLISAGVSVLSAHLKAGGHYVQLYDTTFYDTGKKTGDFTSKINHDIWIPTSFDEWFREVKLPTIGKKKNG